MRPTHMIIGGLLVVTAGVVIVTTTGILEPPSELWPSSKVEMDSSEERIAAIRERLAQKQGVAPEDVQQRHKTDGPADMYGFDVQRLLKEHRSEALENRVVGWVDDLAVEVESAADWRFKSVPELKIVDRADLRSAISSETIEHAHAFDLGILMPGMMPPGTGAAPDQMNGFNGLRYAKVEACTRIFHYTVDDSTLYFAPGNIKAVLDAAGISDASRDAALKSILAHVLTVALLDQQFDLSHRFRQHPTLSGASAYYGVVHGYAAHIQDLLRPVLELSESDNELAKRIAIGAVPLDHALDYMYDAVMEGRFDDWIVSGKQFVEYYLDSGGVERLNQVIIWMPRDLDMIRYPETYRTSIDYVAMHSVLDDCLEFEDLIDIETPDARKIYNIQTDALTEQELSFLIAMQQSATANLHSRPNTNQWVWTCVWVINRTENLGRLNTLLETSLLRRHHQGVETNRVVPGQPVVEMLEALDADIATRTEYAAMGEDRNKPIVVYRVGIDRMLIEAVFRDYPVPHGDMIDRLQDFLRKYRLAVKFTTDMNDSGM